MYERFWRRGLTEQLFGAHNVESSSVLGEAPRSRARLRARGEREMESNFLQRGCHRTDVGQSGRAAVVNGFVCVSCIYLWMFRQVALSGFVSNTTENEVYPQVPN